MDKLDENVITIFIQTIFLLLFGLNNITNTIILL